MIKALPRAARLIRNRHGRYALEASSSSALAAVRVLRKRGERVSSRKLINEEKRQIFNDACARDRLYSKPYINIIARNGAKAKAYKM